MKQLQLIDRIVVEIMREEGQEVTPQFLYELFGTLAAKLADGNKGGQFNWDAEGDPANTSVLWERECPNYGGFHIVSDKSLISQYYYHSEPKPKTLDDDEFKVLSVTREDLKWKGYDVDNLGDEWIEKIASKAGDILLDGDYWDALIFAADHYNTPKKED